MEVNKNENCRCCFNIHNKSEKLFLDGTLGYLIGGVTYIKKPKGFCEFCDIKSTTYIRDIFCHQKGLVSIDLNRVIPKTIIAYCIRADSFLKDFYFVFIKGDRSTMYQHIKLNCNRNPTWRAYARNSYYYKSTKLLNVIYKIGEKNSKLYRLNKTRQMPQIDI